MESDNNSLQPNLFGPQEVELDFATVLCGLIEVKGLGRQGITALNDTLSGRLGRLWDLPPEATLEQLHRARVPKAREVLNQLLDRDHVLSIGRETWEGLQSKGITILGPKDLPLALRYISTPPRWLFVQGDANVIRRKPAVAVVGTRDATKAGLAATRRVVQLLEIYPITVVSGLAEGIDDEAHRASMWSRLRNVAFLGHGIDVVFPNSTKGTRARILDQGGVLATEYFPGEMYQRSYFVQRNRLQAGLADLVIAVEAQAKSGTAHTVDFALKYKKPVVGIVVPGSTLADEIGRAGQMVVDLNTPQGHKHLDEAFQRLIRHTGQTPEPFAPMLERLRRELKIRNMAPAALERLAMELYTIAQQEAERLKKESTGGLK